MLNKSTGTILVQLIVIKQEYIFYFLSGTMSTMRQKTNFESKLIL